MAVSLAQATLDVADEVMGIKVVHGVATGGSATSLIDAVFPWQGETNCAAPDDYYNGGTIWFVSGSRASTTYTTNIVTDWAISTRQGTATFPTGTAVVATDRYAIAPKDFPLYVLRESVNKALDEIGNIEDNDDSSLTTVADQMVYDIPAALLTAHLKQVLIATRTSSPYMYQEHLHWIRRDDQIAFDEGFQPHAAGFQMRLVYELAHSELTADSSLIESAIPRQLIRYLGAAYAFEAMVRATETDRPAIAQGMAQKAMEAREKAFIYTPRIEKTKRSMHGSKWMMVGETSEILPFDPSGTVRLT